MNWLQKFKQWIVGVESYHKNCDLRVHSTEHWVSPQVRRTKYFYVCDKHNVMWSAGETSSV